MQIKSTLNTHIKDYIAQSLILLLKQKPLDDIKINEICQKAGVNRSSFYRNFAN